MQEKRWNIIDPPEQQAVDDLKRAINASDVLATLLIQRGVRDFNAAKTFFNPTVRQLHDPFLMKDMDHAVNRITQAVEGGEHILVYGDYDVDGTTAVSLLYDFILRHYDKVSFYIPDRYKEGYGVSYEGVDFAEDNEVKLMIALDCGVKAIDQIAYARSKGIDFIVCDHHLPGEILPEAVAILNPLQKDCSYPFKSLCGCGIGFKLAQALSTAWDLDREEPYRYMDLVAIATASDIVPMVGENRVITFLGSRQMERALRPGLAAMLEGVGLAEYGQLSKKNLTVSDIVFKIGPRINAAGRMQHGNLAVELLTSATQRQAEAHAALVNQNNLDRREVDHQTRDEALEMIQNDAGLLQSKSTLLFAPHWHKGVVGIAASRVQDHFYRPTIILTESNGKATGSARSVEGFDVHAAIEACADLLENFGGHPAAAGMTLPLTNLEAFRARFEQVVSDTILPEQLVPSLSIDLAVDLAQLTDRFFTQMERMAPFGPGNMRPTFVTHGLMGTSACRRVGDQTHLKLEVYQEGRNQVKMQGIGFGLGDAIEGIQSGRMFSLVYTLEENVYRGVSSLQLLVKDLKFT
jgi:single-stranded-DNA-specific exonuclease